MTLTTTTTYEAVLVEALHGGDERAFVSLARRNGPAMLRVARRYLDGQVGRATGAEGLKRQPLRRH